MMCRVEDAYPWKVFHSEWRTARKAHKCGECRREIEPGERYYYATGITSGYDKWGVFKTCAHCNYAAQWLMAECNGYLFGGVQEELEEHWHEEPLMRSLDLGRRIIGMRRKWRTPTGELVAVPS